jgi:hypothetical protein
MIPPTKLSRRPEERGSLFFMRGEVYLLTAGSLTSVMFLSIASRYLNC